MRRTMHTREWWNWQTRWLQVPVFARTCGFKSRLAHQKNSGVNRGFFLCFLGISIKITYGVGDYIMQKTVALERNIGLDLLKIIACFAVVVLHVTGIVPIKSVGYSLKTTLYYIAGFAVPIFFMVNGYSLLNKTKLNYRYISKKILSILAVVFSWNVLEFIVKLVAEKKMTNPFYTSLSSLIQRDYFWQFWFFGALIIIYLLLPLIHKSFTKLKPALIITTVFVTICLSIDITSIVRSISGHSIVQSQVPQTFRLWTWLTYYFLGGLLGKKQVMDFVLKHLRMSFNWLIFIISLVIMSIYQYKMSFVFMDVRAESFYDNIFTFIYVISLFILVCRQDFSKYKTNLIQQISNNVMGIYIIHVTIMITMTHLYKFNTLFTNISLVFIVFLISLTASLIISKIQFANKMIKI